MCSVSFRRLSRVLSDNRESCAWSCGAERKEHEPLSLSLSLSLFSLHYSSINDYLSSAESVHAQFSRRSFAGPAQVAPPFSMGISPHTEKVCPSPMEKGEPPCGSQRGSPNSTGNNHTQKRHFASQENHTFESGSTIFSGQKCTFLNGPFLSFRHSLVLSPFFLNFLFSSFFNFSFFLFFSSLFSGAENLFFFWPQLLHDFL